MMIMMMIMMIMMIVMAVKVLMMIKMIMHDNDNTGNTAALTPSTNVIRFSTSEHCRNAIGNVTKSKSSKSFKQIKLR